MAIEGSCGEKNKKVPTYGEIFGIVGI